MLRCTVVVKSTYRLVTCRQDVLIRYEISARIIVAMCTSWQVCISSLLSRFVDLHNLVKTSWPDIPYVQEYLLYWTLLASVNLSPLKSTCRLTSSCQDVLTRYTGITIMCRYTCCYISVFEARKGLKLINIYKVGFRGQSPLKLCVFSVFRAKK